MIKIIMMFKKRPDLTRDDFIDYYDNHHVPAMRRLLPVKSSAHRRNFVIPGPNHGDNDFDCITEVLYAEKEQAEAAAQYMADPAIRKQIDEDEDRFVARGSMRIYSVEVHENIFDTISEFGP